MKSDVFKKWSWPQTDRFAIIWPYRRAQCSDLDERKLETGQSQQRMAVSLEQKKKKNGKQKKKRKTRFLEREKSGAMDRTRYCMLLRERNPGASYQQNMRRAIYPTRSKSQGGKQKKEIKRIFGNSYNMLVCSGL